VRCTLVDFWAIFSTNSADANASKDKKSLILLIINLVQFKKNYYSLGYNKN